MSAPNQTDSEQGGYARELFAVQGERVTLDARRGWHCTCTISAEGLQCPHVEQAQTFRQVRGVRREEDTVELQFSAAQLQELSEAAHAEQTDVPPTEEVATPERVGRHPPWRAVAAAAAMAAISSGITYLATTQAQARRAAEPTKLSESLAPSPRSQAAPLREVPASFVNPFDASEVFEFPPGTSDADARDAVAGLLLMRARERQQEVERRLRSRKTADRERLERAATLADSG